MSALRTPPTIGDAAPPPLKPLPEQEITRAWPSTECPLVSVLCATYNHVSMLPIALSGILSQQTGFPFEIIVRDDGSTDGTADVLRQWASRYPKIIVPILEPINTFSSTGSSPWIPMAKCARGTFIAFCDGDDYWIDPYKLRLQADILLRHAEISLVSTAFASVREGRVESVEAYHLDSPCQKEVQSPIIPSTWLFRAKQVDLETEVLNRLVNADNLLLSQLKLMGRTHHISSRVSVVMHRHAHSMFSGSGLDRHSLRMFQVLNSQLWISEYHRKRGQRRIADEQLRYAVTRWRSYLQSIGPTHVARFSLYLMMLLVKDAFRRRSP